MSSVFPVVDIDEITSLLKARKKLYYDAAHHPFAYRTGTDKNNFRVSDDGEPSGTSGRPILEAIDKYNLTDVLIIVTRYFGGIKLGTGGLRRAYFEAADECLKNAMIQEKFITESLILDFDYKYMNLIMRLIEQTESKISENKSGEKCILKIETRLSKSGRLKEEFILVTNGTGKII